MEKKGMKRIENLRLVFLEWPSLRALRLEVLLRVYWAGIDIKVNLIGTGVQMLLGTPTMEKEQDRARSEDGLSTTVCYKTSSECLQPQQWS